MKVKSLKFLLNITIFSVMIFNGNILKAEESAKDPASDNPIIKWIEDNIGADIGIGGATSLVVSLVTLLVVCKIAPGAKCAAVARYILKDLPKKTDSWFANKFNRALRAALEKVIKCSESPGGCKGKLNEILLEGLKSSGFADMIPESFRDSVLKVLDLKNLATLLNIKPSECNTAECIKSAFDKLTAEEVVKLQIKFELLAKQKGITGEAFDGINAAINKLKETVIKLTAFAKGCEAGDCASKLDFSSVLKNFLNQSSTLEANVKQALLKFVDLSEGGKTSLTAFLDLFNTQESDPEVKSGKDTVMKAYMTRAFFNESGTINEFRQFFSSGGINFGKGVLNSEQAAQVMLDAMENGAVTRYLNRNQEVLDALVYLNEQYANPTAFKDQDQVLSLMKQIRTNPKLFMANAGSGDIAQAVQNFIAAQATPPPKIEKVNVNGQLLDPKDVQPFEFVEGSPFYGKNIVEVRLANGTYQLAIVSTTEYQALINNPNVNSFKYTNDVNFMNQKLNIKPVSSQAISAAASALPS